MTDGLAFEMSLAWAAGRSNGQAAEELWRRHNEFVRAVITPLARNPADADDWTQDTWCAALRSFAGYRGAATVRTWLYRLGRNQALQGLRARRRGPPPAFTTDAYCVQPELLQLPGRDLELAIAALPPGQRTVFNLHVIEELPHTVIARRLGVSAVTSRTQYRKAQKKVKYMLARYRAD